MLLIFCSVPAALSELLGESLLDDFLPQALMRLGGRDVVDAQMVVLGVIPGKVPIKIGDGLAVIQEASGIRWSPFHGAEGRFDKRIVIGGFGGGWQVTGACRDLRTASGSV